jgi:hypothetical protein
LTQSLPSFITLSCTTCYSIHSSLSLFSRQLTSCASTSSAALLSYI